MQITFSNLTLTLTLFPSYHLLGRPCIFSLVLMSNILPIDTSASTNDHILGNAHCPRFTISMGYVFSLIIKLLSVIVES